MGWQKGIDCGNMVEEMMGSIGNGVDVTVHISYQYNLSSSYEDILA